MRHGKQQDHMLRHVGVLFCFCFFYFFLINIYLLLSLCFIIIVIVFVVVFDYLFIYFLFFPRLPARLYNPAGGRTQSLLFTMCTRLLQLLDESCS